MDGKIKLNMEYNVNQSFIYWIENVLLPKMGYISDGQNNIGRVLINQTYSICNEKIIIINGDGEIETSVIVKSNGVIVSSSSYSINYYTKEIKFNSTIDNVIIYYKYLTVEVRDSFPEDEVFDSVNVPIISIDIKDSEPYRGYAVGSNENFWSILYYIDIFASNDNIRRNIKNGLQYLIKCEWMPLMDFTSGMILNNDGTINTNFSLSDNFLFHIKDKGNPSGKVFNDVLFSKKMKYRARVDGFITIIY
ncbi:MAG: hypothetical protein M0P71_01405 [Melioribacteraceae bacterium]|nr:hypothetical protein [Melioribacteraceae bacterium]